MSHIEKFKECMRNLTTGVTIVTTQLDNGQREGVTINTISSLSLEPLLVMFALKKSSFFSKNFLQCKHFTMNILSEGQEHIANAFTRQNESKWDNLKLLDNMQTHSPGIDGAIALIECKNYKIYDGGDHNIIIGEVLNTVTLKNKKPLVYFQSRYIKVISDADI